MVNTFQYIVQTMISKTFEVKKNSISKGYSSKLMNQFINSQNFINGHGKIEWEVSNQRSL